MNYRDNQKSSDDRSNHALFGQHVYIPVMREGDRLVTNDWRSQDMILAETGSEQGGLEEQQYPGSSSPCALQVA